MVVVAIAVASSRAEGAPRPWPDDDDVLALARGIHRGVLANGMRYWIIDQDQRPDLAMGIDAGLLHEDDGHSGVARYVAEMVAGSRPNDDRSGQSSSRTFNYGSEIKLRYVEDLEQALTRMRSSLDGELTQRQLRQVTEQEPFDRDWSELAQLAGTRLMRHTQFGISSDPKPDLAAVRAYRHRWYVPHRMTLVVTSSLPWQRVQAGIEKHFATMTDRSTPPDPALADGPPRIVVVHGDKFALSIPVDLPTPHTRRDLAGEAAREIFNRAVNQRLRIAMRPALSETRDVYPSEIRVSPDTIAYEISVWWTAPGDAAAAILARELERIRVHGFTMEELRRARIVPEPHGCTMGNPFDLPEEDCFNTVPRAERGIVPLDCVVEARLLRELATTVTDDDINAWRAIVDVRKASVVTLASSTAVTAAIMKAIEVLPRPWAEVPPLLSTPPRAGRVAHQLPIDDGTELVFANGAHVRLHSTSAGSQGGRVTIDASSPGGMLAAAEADIPAMPYVAAMVREAGLGEHDGVTTRQILDHAQLEIATTVELRHEDIHGAAPEQSVEVLFQAVHLAMTAHRTDALSLGVNTHDDPVAERNAELAKQMTPANHMPARLAADLELGSFEDQVFGSVIMPLVGHPLVQPSLTHAVELYRQRFGNAGDFTFDITGPIQMARLEQLAARYLGSLPDNGRRERAAGMVPVSTRYELVHNDPYLTRGDAKCDLQMRWLAPVTPVTSSFDEGRLWAAVMEVAGNGHVSEALQRDNVGYAMTLAPGYGCEDSTHDVEADVRATLARFAAKTLGDDDMRAIREAYRRRPSLQTKTISDAEVLAITPQAVAHVLAMFRVPTNLVIVKQVIVEEVPYTRADGR